MGDRSAFDANAALAVRAIGTPVYRIPAGCTKSCDYRGICDCMPDVQPMPRVEAAPGPDHEKAARRLRLLVWGVYVVGFLSPIAYGLLQWGTTP